MLVLNFPTPIRSGLYLQGSEGEDFKAFYWLGRLATVSDGRVIENPKALKRGLAKIKRLQRTVSRRQKWSATHRKAVEQLAVANIRANTIQ